MRIVGTLDPEFVKVLSSRNIALDSAALVVHDKYTLGHLDKERKKHDREWVENIVDHLNGRHDLYLDVETNTPLLVFDVERDGHVYKLVLQINKALNARDQTGSKQKITGNLIRTIVIEELVNLTNGKRYEFLGSKK